MKQLHPRTTLIYVGFAAEPIAQSAASWSQPAPGIWWAVEGNVVALLQSPERAERSGRFLDSSLAHVREWSDVATLFGRSRDSSYFDVPRGRVLLTRRTNYGVIYHGNETTAATLSRVAHAFNLDSWKAEVDEHYLMGAEADRLFED
ncbi:MAG: hypothetical protein H0T51_05305 [Pirellulales bacterium]|nr:hypothetical protein [Pirellulales bacterium]